MVRRLSPIGDGELRNTTPTTHALKLPTEFSEKESMMNGVVCVICFDPGGNNLSHRDHATCLSNKNFESAAGEDNKSVDEVFSQPKESYLAVGKDSWISYVVEHELQLVAAQDSLKVFRGGMTMIYMGLMCFDPGGLVARVVCPVDNDLGGLEIAGVPGVIEALFIVRQSALAQEKKKSVLLLCLPIFINQF